jgi:hypothetical protein
MPQKKKKIIKLGQVFGMFPQEGYQFLQIFLPNVIFSQ